MLVVAQYFPPDIGGAATRAFNLAKGLTLNGCDVIVVAGVPHYPHGKIPKQYKWKALKVEQMGKLKVIRTFMPPIKSEGFFNRLLLIGSFAVSSLFAFPLLGKIDSIFASSWMSGLVFGKVKRCPVALNVDDLTPDDLVDLGLIGETSPVVKIAEWAYRLGYVTGDLITPHSPAYAEVLSTKYCVKQGRIHLVRGGVDLTRFQLAKLKPAAGKKFIVLYSGAFSIAYDFEQVLKAAKIVEATVGDVKFVIQGQGELASFIRSKVTELKLKNVEIVDKLLPREMVGELLAQADALVLPLAKFKKPYRGISSKLYEYQAVGKPIICCSEGMPRRHIQETQCGIVVYPGDYNALAKAIIELKNNPTICQLMGERGRKYVETDASLEAIGSTMKQLFETAILES